MMMDFYTRSVSLKVIVNPLSHHFRHSGFLQIFLSDIASLDTNSPNDISQNTFSISIYLASEMLSSTFYGKILGAIFVSGIHPATRAVTCCEGETGLFRFWLAFIWSPDS